MTHIHYACDPSNFKYFDNPRHFFIKGFTKEHRLVNIIVISENLTLNKQIKRADKSKEQTRKKEFNSRYLFSIWELTILVLN